MRRDVSKAGTSGASLFRFMALRRFIGEFFSRVFPPKDVPDAKPALVLRGAAEEGRFEEEGGRRRKGRHTFLGGCCCPTPVRTRRGNALGFSRIIRDLTELRQPELKFRALLEAALDARV